MITREAKLAQIRQQIAKAVGEIDHGDSYAAVLALCEGLSGMLHYLEQDALEALRGSGSAPKEETPSKIKASKR